MKYLINYIMIEKKSQIITLNELNNLLQWSKIVDFWYPLSALVWMPYGYKILNLNDIFLTQLFEKYNYKRYLFPFLISSKEFDNINKKINNFEKGVYNPTESITLRPSGEAAIYPMFRKWIKSENDLPLKAFQIWSMFRQWTSRWFLRPNENDFFVEAHCAFSSKQQAENEVINSNKIVEEYLKWLAIPTLKTIRPPWTNKPVAEKEYAFDVLLPIWETALLNVTYLQMQIFSKAFNISFINKDWNKDYTYQMEFWFSQRAILISIWLLINNNIFLLPSYSPIQIVIIPIDSDNIKLIEYSEKLVSLLEKQKIRVEIDKDNKHISKRFTKYEKIGVPLRIEIGEKEMYVETIKIVRQDTKEIIFSDFNNIINDIEKIFKEIVSYYYDKNEKLLNDRILLCDDVDSISDIVKSWKVAKVHLCYNESCVKELQQKVKVWEILWFDYIEQKWVKKECINCKKNTTDIAFYSRRV